MADYDTKGLHFAGYTGPDCEFTFRAAVTYEPNANALDGGRVLHLVIKDEATVNLVEAPSISDWDAFSTWLNAQPKTKEVARYEHGHLTLNPEYPGAAEMVEELRDWFDAHDMERWGYTFDRSDPQAELTHDFEDAGRER